MLLLELGEIVDILVDNDPETVGLVVRRDVGGLVGLRHDGGYVMRIGVKDGWCQGEQTEEEREERERGRTRGYRGTAGRGRWTFTCSRREGSSLEPSRRACALPQAPR